MPRKTKRPQDNGPDVNLAPFMNMVVILIPLLLLSVVFVQVGVFNVSTDLVTPTEPTKTETEEPRRISMAIGADGARVTVDGDVVEPIERCDSDGPTVCLGEDSSDIRATFAEIRQAAKEGDDARVQTLVDEAMQSYDFRSIYNVLARVKSKHPDEERLLITADPDVPYALLVRAMDVARYRLEKDRYSSDSTFWAAAEQRSRPMFMDAVFAIAQ